MDDDRIEDLAANVERIRENSFAIREDIHTVRNVIVAFTILWVVGVIILLVSLQASESEFGYPTHAVSLAE